MGLESLHLPKDEDLLKVSKLRPCNGTGKWDIFFKKRFSFNAWIHF
jgi:hypothetical protein